MRDMTADAAALPLSFRNPAQERTRSIRHTKASQARALSCASACSTRYDTCYFERIYAEFSGVIENALTDTSDTVYFDRSIVLENKR